MASLVVVMSQDADMLNRRVGRGPCTGLGATTRVADPPDFWQLGLLDVQAILHNVGDTASETKYNSETFLPSKRFKAIRYL